MSLRTVRVVFWVNVSDSSGAGLSGKSAVKRSVVVVVVVVVVVECDGCSVL